MICGVINILLVTVNVYMHIISCTIFAISNFLRIYKIIVRILYMNNKVRKQQWQVGIYVRIQRMPFREHYPICIYILCSPHKARMPRLRLPRSLSAIEVSIQMLKLELKI